MTSFHWEDPMLLRLSHIICFHGVTLKVQEDLHKKSGWTQHEPVAVELPPCTCCKRPHPHEQSDATKCRCGLRARGIMATVQATSCGGADTSSIALVFAVNAGWPLPMTRFSDVVAAFEDHGRSAAGQRGRQESESSVLAAFCDGSSIIYYKVSSGIDLK